MKRLHSVMVRGKRHEWGLPVYTTRKTAAAWRADGLEVNEVVNVIPAWIVDLGLARPWCFLQNIFNFRSPFNGAR